jgi:hypothetical protein
MTLARIAAILLLCATIAHADLPPVNLSLAPDDQSVYAPPQPPREDEGVNQGAVNFELTFRYMTDYMYRGVDRSEFGSEDSPNLQFDARLSFNLGAFPHPFVGAFVNVYDSDPISRFQEIRPYFGATWTLRPFEFEAGNITYIFPDRDHLDTGEAYGKITFDDSWLWASNRKIITPYVYGAYDYDKYNGWYIEAGLTHEFAIEDWGITLTAVGNFAYVIGNEQFSKDGDQDTGFQHWEVGLIGRYSLNRLFNVNTRFGTWTLEGYLYYTDEMDNDLKVENQVWGGMGIGFRY